MNPNAPRWSELLAPYRAGDWQGLMDRLRPLVDAEPGDLASRALLARVALLAGSPALALVQYEKLLPLAVGRGDLFRALAAQKGLDALSPRATQHVHRYGALHTWFTSLRRGRPLASVGRGLALTPRALLALPRDAFERIAEGCALEPLGLGRREIAPAVRVVLYGRVRWIADGAETCAEEGDTLPAPADAAASMTVAPELPSECLAFGLGLALPALEESRPAPPVVVAPRTVDEAPPDDDPTNRRRAPRISVEVGRTVALLDLAGEATGPLEPHLFDLSVGGMCIGFPNGELSRLREMLADALLVFRIDVPHGEPIVGSARVVWIRHPDSADAAVRRQVRMGLEFVPLPDEDKERLRLELRRVSREAREARGAVARNG